MVLSFVVSPSVPSPDGGETRGLLDPSEIPIPFGIIYFRSSDECVWVPFTPFMHLNFFI